MAEATDYFELLEQVRQGEVESFDVYPPTFNDFQAVWAQYSYQNMIYGVAQENGKVTYYKK